MEEIKKINSLLSFREWPNKAREEVIDKFNELIDTINLQSKEIHHLRCVIDGKRNTKFSELVEKRRVLRKNK